MDLEESLPRLLNGRYRLEAELGHGGMGVVYRATDLTMKRQVAVKVIKTGSGENRSLDEEVASRFVREAKHTARLQHENIVQVFDVGRGADGELFMVMELLEGESLSLRLRRDGRMTPDDVVHIGVQICNALEVAHKAGVVHRDLKPANIMIVRRGADERFVKVLDFGVAKSYAAENETQLTHTGMLVGTVEYMAPEQIMGKGVDGRTDIYSLGIVLYRMALAKLPFKDGGVPALIHAHLNVMPKPLREVAPDIPGELDRVVLRCLAKAPERRYESMAEVARALGESLRSPDVIDLGYGGDAYEDGDRTQVASSPAAGRGAPVDPDHTAVMTQRASTPDGDLRTSVDRDKKNVCAMCHTVNFTHARACVSCGMMLLAEPGFDSANAQAPAPPGPWQPASTPTSVPRWTPAPPGYGAVPPPRGAPSAGIPPGARPPGGPGYGYPLAPPNGGPGPEAAPPEAKPRSVWSRLLAWAGLKSS